MIFKKSTLGSVAVNASRSVCFPARILGAQIRDARENGVSEAVIAPPCFDDGADVDPQSDIRHDRFDAAEEAFLAGAPQQQVAAEVQPAAAPPTSVGEPSIPDPVEE
jgi:hypothetical protein